MTDTTYYKTLSADGRSCNGGNAKWSLPTKNEDGTWTPGEWMPEVKDIGPCHRGYHLFEAKDVLEWANETCYVAEYRGAVIVDDKKIVAESARLLRPVPNWNERTLRLFACRVAEDVLPIFEQDYPEDKRPRDAIDTARRFADGEATSEELAAAWDATRAAARAAAWDATWAAAWDATRAAAWDAARAAAWDATWAAAWDATRAAAWEKYTAWLWEMTA